MVAARYLADWGAVVTLYMTSARRNEVKFEECRERRVRIVEASEDLECWQLASYVSLADLVLDAVLGIGARYGLDPPLRGIFESIGQMKAQRQHPIFVALDLPTGLDADSGNCDMKQFLGRRHAHTRCSQGRVVSVPRRRTRRDARNAAHRPARRR